jgi:hypothetical protein
MAILGHFFPQKKPTFVSIEWHIFLWVLYTKSSPLKETPRLCGPQMDQPFFLLAILFRLKTKSNIKNSKMKSFYSEVKGKKKRSKESPDFIIWVFIV